MSAVRTFMVREHRQLEEALAIAPLRDLALQPLVYDNWRAVLDCGHNGHTAADGAQQR